MTLLLALLDLLATLWWVSMVGLVGLLLAASIHGLREDLRNMEDQ